jgi:anti-sigma-K factor RskA
MNTGPDHERFQDTAGSYVLGAMPDAERADFEAHLTSCAVCQAEIDELAVAVEALPTSVPAMVPPPALKARIMAEVEREAALLASASSPPREAKTRRRRRFAAFPFSPLVAALACSALLVGLVAGGLIFGGGGTREVRVLGPAGVSAKLQVDGDNATIVAKNLPPAPDGQTYMVWLVPKGSKSPEPTSTLFTPRSDGSATASVTGVEDASTVIVNTEPPGGSERPTSDPVLTASLT